MVNVTTSDILTEQHIRRVMEEERMYTLVWDQMFETVPMDDSIASNTMEIPEDDGLMGKPDRVQEGSEFPREEEDYSTTSITVSKHGFEVAISMESTLYSVFDQVARQTEKAARRMSEYLNELAFSEVDGNLHPNSPISTGAFDFEAVTQAKRDLMNDQLTPDLFVINPAAEQVLLNSDSYQRASELGDQITREGDIVSGRFAGLDVVVDNSGLLGGDTTAEGIVADTSEYGYEVVKQDVATDNYDDPSRQSEIYQIYTIRAYKAIHDDAAIKVTA